MEEKLKGLINAGGTTYLCQGIKVAAKVLAGAVGLKRIIIVTDGVPSSSSNEEIIELIEQQIKENTIIDTVGVGNRRLANVNIRSLKAYNEEFLNDISARTAGQFSFVCDVKKLEKKEFEKLAQAKRFFFA